MGKAMTGLFDRVRHWLGLGRRTPSRLSPAGAAQIGRELESTQEIEFDCEQVYQLLDQFAEAVRHGQNGAPWVPLIRAHLEKCSDCRKEFEALLKVLHATWA
jgi:hypothetical protein